MSGSEAWSWRCAAAVSSIEVTSAWLGEGGDASGD